MGCTPTWDKTSQPQPVLQKIVSNRQIVKLQYLCDPSQLESKQSNSLRHTAISNQEDDRILEKDRKQLAQKQLKIKFLKENKHFVDMSIEASTYVNNALILISGNPYLYDQSFPLIGLNKKTLAQKQNRANNLARRSEKATLQLKKERERARSQVKSNMFKTNHSHKPEKPFKKTSRVNKQNKSLTNMNYFNEVRQKFSQKYDKVGVLLLASKSIIQ